MSARRALLLAILHLAPAAPATAGDETAGDDVGWAALPGGFAPWPGRIRLEAGGRPLDLEIEAEPSWSAQGTWEVEADGARLRFSRGEGRGEVSVLVAGGTAEVAAGAELSLPGFAGAVPARLSPRGSPDVALLGIAGGGLDAARGLHDPRSDRGLDLGLVDDDLSIRSDRAGSGLTLRIGGRLPRGREVVLLAWAERDRVLALPADRPSGGPRGAPPAGWSLPGGESLLPRAEEIAREACLPPGAVLEIGDGWQGKSRKTFAGPARDWLAALEGAGGAPAVAERIPAARLESLGFRPVLWIVPHGQGERRVFDASPGAFVRDQDGSAVPSRFLGPYVVDGTSAEGKAYLTGLFARLRASGCAAFRLAGLGEALAFYRRELAKLSIPPSRPIEVLRETIRAARAGAGDALLLGDVDTPLELAGELDGARPVLPAGEAFEPLGLDALSAARGYRFHASAWWAECLPVARWEAEGSPDAARSRIAFAALTGRALVASAAEAPPDWAREALRRAWPPLPVRPIDLFPREGTPRVWRLEAGESGAAASIAGVFNSSAVQSALVELSPRDLGLARAGGTGRLLLFDLANETFAGAPSGPVDLLLLPGRSRLLAAARDLGRPQVVAASVHVLGGAGLLEDVAWSEERLELAGRLAAPPGGTGASGRGRLHIAAGHPYRALRAEAAGAPAEVENRGGHVVVSLPDPAGAPVRFAVVFERAAGPAPAAAGGAPGGPHDAAPGGLEATFSEEERKPILAWRGVAGGLDAWRSVDGFAVLRDGLEIGRTRGTSFLDRGAARGVTYRYWVRAIPAAGAAAGPTRSLESAAVALEVPRAADAFLDGWCVASYRGHGAPVLRRSASGGPLSMGGRRFERGIGVRAPSRVEYLIEGAYEAFEAVPGVDDAARFGGSVVFAVEVDGAERFRSRTVRGGPEEPEPVRVPIAGGRVLALIVEDAGDGTDGDLADWAAARVIAPPGR